MRYNGNKSGRQRKEICRSFTCISPWFMFCRWFNGGKSRGSGSGRFVGRNSSRNFEGSSSSREDVAAQIGKEASLNLGIGFGLICLVAARRNELKMVALYKKIETLFQNLRTEFQNQEKKPDSKPFKSSISSSFSNDGVHETVYDKEHNRSGQYSSSHDVRGPEIGIGCKTYSYRREKSLRMDQIEAELEAEFGRMQVQMDGEFCVNCSEQQCSEINVEESAPEWSQETGLEEVIEQHDFSYHEYYGVPPRELERKLHDLLEERQQERISELESALEYAIEKLEEKETELSWWKDTARLICLHFPAIPGLVRQMNQDIHCTEPDFEVKQRGKSLVIEELHM